MSAHTKGPWMYRPDMAVTGAKHRVMQADNYDDVAETSGQPGFSDETRAANARLIAAAPRMLEALAGSADEFDRILAKPKIPEHVRGSLIHLRAEFRALVASVDGDQ